MWEEEAFGSDMNLASKMDTPQHVHIKHVILIPARIPKRKCLIYVCIDVVISDQSASS